MKRILLAALFISAIGLTGCPMQIGVPVDDGSYTETQWLPGKWKLTTAEVLNGYKVVARKEPGQLDVYSLDTGKVTGKPKKIVLSEVKGILFASIYVKEEKPDKKSGYYIYRINKESDSELELIPVRQYTSISLKTPADSIRRFLEVYGKSDIYERATIEHYSKQ